MAERGPAPWWAAVEAQGLDHLSAPELAHALQELAQDRPAFLGVLAAASDYPRHSLCSRRRPDRAELVELDRRLPRARAVVLPEDDLAVRTALGVFEVLLVLDPLWQAPELLYASWHSSQGILPEHARRLHVMLSPAVALSSVRDRLCFIPDHLPGSWDPFPMPPRTPGPAALRRAAGLLYWADVLRGVALAGPPAVAQALRTLARAGPDLHSAAGAEIAISLPEAECTCPPGLSQRWAAVYDALADDPAPLASLMTPGAAPWCLGLGATALPDVSLALRRALAGRPIQSGQPGVPHRLARRSVYLIPA